MAGYGVTGIRIDAAKHQDDGEMSGITSQIPSSMSVWQEVIGSDGEVTYHSISIRFDQLKLTRGSVLSS